MHEYELLVSKDTQPDADSHAPRVN